MKRMMGIKETIQSILSDAGALGEFVPYLARFILPVMAVVIFFRCLLPLMSGGRRAKPWAYLVIAGGDMRPLTHWENSIGRSPTCDVVVNIPSISRIHAVLSRRNDVWHISDLDSKGGVSINGEAVAGQRIIEQDDVVKLSELQISIVPVSQGIGDGYEEKFEKKRVLERIAETAARIAARFGAGTTLIFIILFQILGFISLALTADAGFQSKVYVAFLLYMLLELVYYIGTRFSGRKFIEIELLAFFLSGISMFVCASASPDAMVKQFVAVVLGLVLLLVLQFFLNNPERARTARYVFAVGALLLLAANLLLATAQNGALNWIRIGSLSVQPSELVKVAFVFAGGATLDRLLSSKNFMKFMALSGACILALVVMRDFGTAMIFFITFVVITFMRSGDIKKLSLIIGMAVAGAAIVVSFLPYITARFSVWRHAWEFADSTGYQQVRTMVYTASGGLFGVGPGNGNLRYVAAADTDLVFGLLAEEWGLVVALVCALVPLALAVFAFMSVKSSRSAFYAIVACGAATLFLVQASLNIFGSLDILPLTGVTLPFVSNGGSSMLSCWGLIACIKSIDERHRAQSLGNEEGAE
jgi:cell division protein FtsW (lipid II flippase)